MAARTYAAGLRRDLDVLEVLGGEEASRRGGLGVLRVAELVGREKTQVSRSLASLAEEGLVERDPELLAYRLGWRVFALAARTAEARLAEVAAPHLRRLVAQVHETVHLCVLRGGGVLTLLSEAPRHAFRGLGWEGVSVPAPRTSAGRVLVSDLDRAALTEWFPAQELRAAPPQQRIRTIDQLVAETRWIAAHGYAKVDGEFEEGLVGVSAPVRDFRGQIVAAINISAPKGRFGPKLDAGGEATAAVARQLSQDLGHRHGEASPSVTGSGRRPGR